MSVFEHTWQLAEHRVFYRRPTHTGVLLSLRPRCAGSLAQPSQAMPRCAESSGGAAAPRPPGVFDFAHVLHLAPAHTPRGVLYRSPFFPGWERGGEGCGDGPVGPGRPPPCPVSVQKGERTAPAERRTRSPRRGGGEAAVPRWAAPGHSTPPPPPQPPPVAAAAARGAQRCRPLPEPLGAGMALAFWREFACGQCCAAKPAPSSHYTLLYL